MKEEKKKEVQKTVECKQEDRKERRTKTPEPAPVEAKQTDPKRTKKRTVILSSDSDDAFVKNPEVKTEVKLEKKTRAKKQRVEKESEGRENDEKEPEGKKERKPRAKSERKSKEKSDKGFEVEVEAKPATTTPKPNPSKKTNQAKPKEKVAISGSYRPRWLASDREPPKHGSKPIPRGKADCLSGMVFVLTGLNESLTRDEMSNLIQNHGG